MSLSWVVLLANASMALIVFCFGLVARRDATTHLLRRPALLARSMVAMFVLAPLVAVSLALALDVDRALRAALVVLALSPVPPILPRQEMTLRGSTSYALGLLGIATLCSILVVPAGLALVGWLIGRPLTLPWSVVAKPVAISVLLPLAAGVVVGRLAPAFAQRVARPLARSAAAVLIVALVAAVAVTWREIVIELQVGAFVAIAIATAICLAIGHLLGGPDPAERSVLALSTATRHPGVALAACSALEPNEPALLAGVLLYFLTAMLLSLGYIASRTSTKAHDAAAPR